MESMKAEVGRAVKQLIEQLDAKFSTT